MLYKPMSADVQMLRERFALFFRRYHDDAESKKKIRNAPNKKRTFIDSQRVYVRGGAGGQGLPKYGGVGGDGGNVLVVARKGEALINLRRSNPTLRYVAGAGGNSTKFCLKGDKGADVEILVPPGVELVTDGGHVIGDLDQDGSSAIIAAGGRGGNQENQFIGLRGEARNVRLNLKLIADVGLVGFPNAGKSTFLEAVSRAKPKIANYPFTTVRPQIGVAEFADFRRISVADLPGLIEGAHANFGMGHSFLKHVERTKLLLFIVDLNGFQLAQGYPQRTAFQTVLLLNRELELYRPDLLDKPAILVANKMDSDPSGTLTEELVLCMKNLPESASEAMEKEMLPGRLMKFDEVLVMSAKSRVNTQLVMDKVRSLLDEYADKELTKSLKEKSLVHFDQEECGVLSKHLEHAKRKLV